MLGKYFRTSAAFTPASLGSTLVLWLKADSLSLNDGDPVSSWADSSGTGNTATGTTTTRPLYKVNILNGMPVVRFDGTDDKLLVADANSIDLTGDQTIFVVVKYSGTKGALIDHYDNGGGFTGYGFEIGQATPSKLSYWSSGKGSRQSDTPDLTTGAFHLVAIIRTSGSVVFYTDGTAGATLTGHGNAASTNSLSIGVLPDGTTTPLNGDIAEIIVCDTAMAGTNLTNLKTYIANKYALTIA